MKQEEAENYDNKWIIISAVSMGTFLATLDGSIVNVSLPTMVSSLKTNFTMIQWVVLSYLLTVTTLMLSIGRLGDILGKKRIYALGFAIFTLASTLCGFAAHVHYLIGFRIIQGIGAAMVMALGPAITTEAFPPYQRGKAMGVIGAVVSIGIVAGPSLGGMIIDLLSWHWIFFVNIPTGLIGLWMVIRYVPNIKPDEKQPFDYVGAFFLFASLFLFLISLSLGQVRGFANPLILGLLSGALLFILLFIKVEQKSKHPMLHLELFKNPLLCVNLVTGFMTFVAMGGVLILIPFYLEFVLGYPTMKVGFLISVIPILMGIFSPISGSLSDKWGTRPITLAGLMVLALSYMFSGTLNVHTHEIGFMVRIAGIGIGTGLFLSPNNSAIMGAGPRQQLGIVSGLMAISRTLGQTVGVSLIGTLWAVRIRTITGRLNLSDVTQAPVNAQIKGLEFVFYCVSAMIFVGFCLSIYGYFLENKLKKSQRA